MRSLWSYQLAFKPDAFCPLPESLVSLSEGYFLLQKLYTFKKETVWLWNLREVTLKTVE